MYLCVVLSQVTYFLKGLKMSTRKFTYFLEPLDAFTNEILGKNLPTENPMENTPCSDNCRHDLWRCGYMFFAKIRKSREQINLRVKFWWQEGSGQIRPFFPLSRKKKS
jgi:hypothetical protein